MEGNERRNNIIGILKGNSEPVSGTALAARLGVSRQVIVQDIALLRAADKNIISTNKGYMYFAPDTGKFKRTFRVCHTDDKMRDELNCIVDNGGRVLDVMVEHGVYGTITADLQMCTRRDVNDFMEKIGSETSKPLKLLTDGIHYHTVEAESESALDIIERELKRRGYLI
ncbi:MAG: transcription repressor NadR [Butyrivibrio sp.]|nr:transcription repressor NadR [Butyrivibrio sp.]